MFDKKLRKLKQQLQNAQSYQEWKKIATEYDLASGMEDWKKVDYSDLYDSDEIKFRLDQLRLYRELGDDRGLLFLLNEGIHGNMGGMGNPRLYERALVGTKKLITDYIDEVNNALWYLAELDHRIISFEEKLDFFRRASLCFGRSALMLSGGAQIGNFHLGVLKALVKENLLPDVISGASAGSVFAALVGTRTNEELAVSLDEEHLLSQLKQEEAIYKNIARQKDAVSLRNLSRLLKQIIPNLTFQEAYEKTGRKINISVAPYGAKQKSRLLNSIASPNVLIRSAVMASCALPGVFPPVTLMAKDKDGQVKTYLPTRKWIDGSVSNDLPAKRLTRLYRANHFIVSLTNPLVLPFVKNTNAEQGILGPLRKLGWAIVQETSRFNYSISKPFLKYLPPSVAAAASTINSVIQQNYLGDINILADFGLKNPQKILSPLSYKELAKLVKAGEKATWPKLEMIRNTTKIGRTLDEILAAYEEAELEATRLIHEN